MAKPKLLVILGPTTSGKSDLAVRLAKKFNGEVISADSRQVYKGLNIGTGKITKKEMRGITHHLLDVADPRHPYSVARYKKEAEKIIRCIVRKGNVPILCGGTGFYIQALVDNVVLPDVRPNPVLRKKLEQKSTDQLFKMLLKKDTERARSIDPRNRRRLIRALEIAAVLKKVPPPAHQEPFYDTLQIGIQTEHKKLKRKIEQRLQARLKKGMVAEARRLHTQGLPWKRMEELGLEYRALARLLQKKINRQTLEKELTTAIWHYAKRQKTWFKRDKRIEWFRLTPYRLLENRVETFLNT